jgi:hypothetical protein
MLDEFRTHPRETLSGIIQRRRERDSDWRVPLSVRLLERMFARDSRTRDRFGALALRVFRVRKQADLASSHGSSQAVPPRL